MLLAVLPEFSDHLVGEGVFERLGVGMGRDDVVDGGEGALRHLHRQVEIAQHAEGLGTGDLVDQVGADEELGLTVGQGGYGVILPHLSKRFLGTDMGDSLED